MNLLATFCILYFTLFISSQQETSDESVFLSFISSCDVPNLNEEVRNDCLKKTIEFIRDEFAAGKSFFGIPRIEPFQLEKFSFIQKENNVNMNATFSDIWVDGFSRFKILNLKNNYERKEIILEAGMDDLNMDGLYKVKGNILLLPLNGNGKFTAAIKNIWVKAIFQLAIEELNQKQQIQTQNVTLNLRVGNFNVFLTGLQVDDPVIEESIIHFINNNNEFILNEIEPELVREMANILKIYMNLIYNNVPARYIFGETIK